MALCDGNRLENIDDDSPVFPEGNYYYDLTDPDFEKLVTSARQMQNTYVIMNGETEYFEYNLDERTYLAERVRIMVFGPRPGNEVYKLRETRDAMRIMRKIVKVSGGTKATVRVNVAYLSAFTYDKNEEFIATEIPVFKLGFGDDLPCRFMDTKGIVFNSIQDLIGSIGARFVGGIMYPDGLCHKITGDCTINLVYTESEATKLENRTLDTIETILDFASKVLGYTNVAISLPLCVYAVICKKLVKIISNLGKVTKIIQLASTAIAITKTSIQLERCYREGRYVDAGGKAIFLIALALLSKDQIRRFQVSATTSPEDVAEMYGNWYKTKFYTLKVSTTITTYVCIVQSIYTLYKQSEWTFWDLCDLSKSLYALYNVVISPLTIEAILESDQMKTMVTMEKSLFDNLSKLTSYQSIRQATDLIEVVNRKLIKIPDSDHFYHQTQRFLAPRNGDDRNEVHEEVEISNDLFDEAEA